MTRISRRTPAAGGLLLLLSLLFTGIPAAPAQPSTLAGPDLIDALRRGGYVLFLRHAESDSARPDAERVKLDDCATQRLLSDAGREQARQIGRAFTALRIPVKTVLSSAYCRCLETARLAFGAVEVAPFLYFAVDADRTSRARVGSELRRALATPPAAGMNTVLVSHTANLKEATGIWPKPEGVVHVFRPTASGDLVNVARVEPGEWIRLAAALSPR